MPYEVIFRTLTLFGINYFLVMVGLLIIISQKSRGTVTWIVSGSVFLYLILTLPLVTERIESYVNHVDPSIWEKWIFLPAAVFIIIFVWILKQSPLSIKIPLIIPPTVVLALFLLDFIDENIYFALTGAQLSICLLYLTFKRINARINRS